MRVQRMGPPCMGRLRQSRPLPQYVHSRQRGRSPSISESPAVSGCRPCCGCPSGSQRKSGSHSCMSCRHFLERDCPCMRHWHVWPKEAEILPADAPLRHCMRMSCAVCRCHRRWRCRRSRFRRASLEWCVPARRAERSMRFCKRLRLFSQRLMCCVNPCAVRSPTHSFCWRRHFFPFC